MKKNFIVLATIVYVCAINSAAFFGYQCNKLHEKCAMIEKQNREMRAKIGNYEEVLDSIDNAHHHGYLKTLRAYQELRLTMKRIDL